VRSLGKGRFQGFSRKTFTFLRDLGRHNDKAWLETHRSIYEEHVPAPLRDLVNDLADFMLGIDLSFEVAPASAEEAHSCS
jgi:uncharacterized protein (DUF2461 family)